MQRIQQAKSVLPSQRVKRVVADDAGLVVNGASTLVSCCTEEDPAVGEPKDSIHLSKK
jgi:hypothetical protein